MAVWPIPQFTQSETSRNRRCIIYIVYLGNELSQKTHGAEFNARVQALFGIVLKMASVAISSFAFRLVTNSTQKSNSIIATLTDNGNEQYTGPLETLDFTTSSIN